MFLLLIFVYELREAFNPTPYLEYIYIIIYIYRCIHIIIITYYIRGDRMTKRTLQTETAKLFFDVPLDCPS